MPKRNKLQDTPMSQSAGLTGFKITLGVLGVVIVGLIIAIVSVKVVNNGPVDNGSTETTDEVVMETNDENENLPDEVREMIETYQVTLDDSAISDTEKGDIYITRAYSLMEYMVNHEGVDLCGYIVSDTNEAKRLAGDEIAESADYIASTCLGDDYGKNDEFTYTIILEDK